jgi:transposase-like protein
MSIIQGKILEGSTIHTDEWKTYDGLVINGYNHYRVFHSKNEFARDKSHVNGTEAFWSFAKRRLAKFNGLKDETFLMYLKECEFCDNNSDMDLAKILTNLVNKQKKDASLEPKNITPKNNHKFTFQKQNRACRELWFFANFRPSPLCNGLALPDLPFPTDSCPQPPVL